MKTERQAALWSSERANDRWKDKEGTANQGRSRTDGEAETAGDLAKNRKILNANKTNNPMNRASVRKGEPIACLAGTDP